MAPLKPSGSDLFDVSREYSTLALRDLIAARDLFHVHLMSKRHVVGTALGKYLIRLSEHWPKGSQELQKHDARQRRAVRKPPRTLLNSEVRPYSWPCVLVFVDQWVNEADMRRLKLKASDLVPNTLYMPDGTRVPVCVVYAPPDEVRPEGGQPIHFAESFMGGGYPLSLRVQGQDRFASAGCLVTDGHATYALTNRHVVGEPGEPVYARINGSEVRVGESSDKQLTRVPFCDLFPEWPGKNVYVNFDVGLVKLDDINQWTAQVFGVGTVGKLADFGLHNLSLRLISAPVSAYGAASGAMLGQVFGLFYRYRSVGGTDYVADYLIGPRPGRSLRTLPGDSGTLWMLELDEPESRHMPLALQWGGQRFTDGTGHASAPYALATGLGIACVQLDVQLVRDWNIGLNEYWGAVGHYTIATRAVERVKSASLRKLMQANLSRITYPASAITAKTGVGLTKAAFCPLADVPDMVWKARIKGRVRPTERTNHFANIDAKDSKGETLLQKCLKSDANLDPKVWLAYFADAKVKQSHAEKSLLPHRVWQIYQEMVSFAKKGKNKEFVCAAGVLSHYIGDACQPLHISFMHDGDPGDTQTVAGKVVSRSKGVHSAYEDDMVNRNIVDIRKGLMGSSPKLPAKVKGGRKAAAMCIRLMSTTFAHTPPRTLCKAFADAGGKAAGKAAADALWKKYKKKTIANMSAGAATLAALWESAWAEGKGKAPAAPTAFDESALRTLYLRKTFLQSYTLDKIGPILKG